MTLNYRENSKLIWIIAGGLIAIILLVIIYLWMNNTAEPKAQPVLPNKTVTAAPVVQPTAEPAASEPDTATLVDEKILKDEVSNNASTAKEEMAKLEDIQKQLDEQQNMLNTQHADADQLIKLKEDQIKLLEKQLAETKT